MHLNALAATSKRNYHPCEIKYIMKEIELSFYMFKSTSKYRCIHNHAKIAQALSALNKTVTIYISR